MQYTSFDSLTVYKICEYLEDSPLILRNVFKNAEIFNVIAQLRELEKMDSIDTVPEKVAKYLLDASSVLRITPTIVKWLVLRNMNYSSAYHVCYFNNKQLLLLRNEMVASIMMDMNKEYADSPEKRVLLLAKYGVYFTGYWATITKLHNNVSKEYAQEILKYIPKKIMIQQLSCASWVNSKNSSLFSELLGNPIKDRCTWNLYKNMSTSEDLWLTTELSIGEVILCRMNYCINEMIVPIALHQGRSSKKSKRYVLYLLKEIDIHDITERIVVSPTGHGAAPRHKKIVELENIYKIMSHDELLNVDWLKHKCEYAITCGNRIEFLKYFLGLHKLIRIMNDHYSVLYNIYNDNINFCSKIFDQDTFRWIYEESQIYLTCDEAPEE